MDGVGFKAKTKITRKSKSIITMKNFGGKGTTTVFMRENKTTSFTNEQYQLVKENRQKKLYDVQDIQRELEDMTEDEDEVNEMNSPYQKKVWLVKKDIKIGFKRD